MTLEKAKLFWKLGEEHKEIIAIPYDDKMDYYSFVKKCHDNGFRQVIVTSEAMIHLIEQIIRAGFRIPEIEMAEEEEEFGNDVRDLLDRLEKDRTLLRCLMTLLGFLAERSSIEIQRVGFRGRTKSGVAVEGFVQSNGLMGANKEVSKKIFEAIGAAIKEYVFGC